MSRIAGAHAYLATVDASGIVTVSEDTVTITATYATRLLGLVRIASLTVQGSGSAYPQRGITAVSLQFANSDALNGGNRKAAGAL